MIAYILPVLAGLVGAVLLSKGRYYFFFVLFASFLMVALKGDVDKDYLGYETLFNMAPTWVDGYSAFHEYATQVAIEPGFLFLNVTFKSLGFGFNSIFIFAAATSFLFIYLIANSLPGNKFLIFIFLYVSCFIGLWVQIRFGLACLLVLYAAILFAKVKYFEALLVILFSLSLHSVTLIVIFGYLIYRVLCTKEVSARAITTFLLIFSVFISFVSFGDLLAAGLSSFNSRYEVYGMDEGGSRISFLIRLALFSSLILLVKNDFFKDRTKMTFFALSLCAVLVWSFGWGVSILYRLGTLFEFGFCIFLCRDAYKYTLNYSIALLVIFLLLAWRFYYVLLEVDAYKFFFVG